MAHDHAYAAAGLAACWSQLILVTPGAWLEVAGGADPPAAALYSLGCAIEVHLHLQKVATPSGFVSLDGGRPGPVLSMLLPRSLAIQTVRMYDLGQPAPLVG
jgi:hypothetical protein